MIDFENLDIGAAERHAYVTGDTVSAALCARIAELGVMKVASWVIINKATRQAIFETFNENTAKAINTRLYEAIPILEWLQQVALLEKGKK